MEPPAHLEDRVVSELVRQGLIQANEKAAVQRSGWSIMRASLAAAACVGLLMVGVWIGRATAPGGFGASPLTGAETDLYALLLYETEGYVEPTGSEALGFYNEYSRWVATAAERGQFVTGEDLEVNRGWLLAPSDDGVMVESATTVAAGAPLSGMFFVRAEDADQALAIAKLLPHLKHGGRVLVQKTIPTDKPPIVEG